ncbi:hypothetical protein PSTEL_23780 [Paenibacillus stellifer]|uniref:Nucleotidyltransferase n=1 Tax=Paenibacillus stellifer TaxID=169760 RepID=A0A089NA13_9BACL|nr:nucleotidyltransferase [Paenibacillus stellifer]AIQ65679.1 hypothetical protein PSTEL_23780 [Paenibacillus stellifer]
MANITYSTQMEDLLHRIGMEIQLTQTQYSDAETSYNAVANVLSEHDKFKDARLVIYPQGSLRIGTTVKPLKEQEFDLDCVLEIDGNEETFNDPMELLNLLEKILLSHGVYSSMVSKKNRCIRLTYASNYHMDILPARPTIGHAPYCVKVPDSITGGWKDSNPKGYATWFDKIANDFIKNEYFEKSAEIQPLPESEPVEIKPPLKRAVQLLKRGRDLYFKEDSEHAPISVILTTLAAQHYQKQGSVYEALLGILQGINQLTKNDESIVVLNPTNHKEIFSERWDQNPELYVAFKKFIGDFHNYWVELPKLKGAGLLETGNYLSNYFGKDLIEKSFTKEAQYKQALREKGKLGVLANGSILAATTVPHTIPISKNTFYGTP